MDQHLARLQSIIARAEESRDPCAAEPPRQPPQPQPPQLPSTPAAMLDDACAEALRVCCAAREDGATAPGAQAFFRYLLRHMRLAHQVSMLEGAHETDALLAALGAEPYHLRETPPAVLERVLARLGAPAEWKPPERSEGGRRDPERSEGVPPCCEAAPAQPLRGIGSPPSAAKGGAGTSSAAKGSTSRSLSLPGPPRQLPQTFASGLQDVRAAEAEAAQSSAGVG